MIRHAIAAKRDAQEYPDDDQRPLSAVGRKRQRRVAKALRRMDCAPDRIITSPRVRARQTAEIIAKELGGGATMEESEALGRGYSPAAVLGLLSRFRDSETIVLVGHEPDFSALAAVLLGPDSGPEIRFKKGAVLGLSFDHHPAPGEATLAFFYRAEDLAALV